MRNSIAHDSGHKNKVLSLNRNKSFLLSGLYYGVNHGWGTKTPNDEFVRGWLRRRDSNYYVFGYQWVQQVKSWICDPPPSLSR